MQATTKMGEFELMNPIILIAILSSILLWAIRMVFTLASKTNLPPSPPKLPIIGNLHQVGKLQLHRDLHSLAKKHGPIMLLRFGRTPFLIISSPDLAREIMKTHDLICASRPLYMYKPFRKLVYGCRDVAAAVYGEEWRKMRSTLVLHLLSSKRVQASRSIREEETALLVGKIKESSSAPVNLSAMFVEMDAVCRSTFGRKYSGSGNGRKFLLLLSDFMELLISIDVGDFIPWLGWVSRVNGFDERLDRVAKRDGSGFGECDSRTGRSSQGGSGFLWGDAPSLRW